MKGLVAALLRVISGANVRWGGCHPDSRQRVYFANHTSHLDTAILWASLPGELRCLVRPVAARAYWMRTRVRRYLAASVFHAVLIERGRASVHDNPVDHLVETLGQHSSLIIFPEGTRTLDGEIAGFKSGLYHLAKRRPDVELIPVLIDNLNRILPKGEFLPVPLLSSLSFGTPIQLAPGEAKQAFLERARTSVISLRQV